MSILRTDVSGNPTPAHNQPTVVSEEPSKRTRRAMPGLPNDYHLVLTAPPDPMAKVAQLKILGDRRSATSLGLFVVLFFSLALTLLAVGEALRLALPEAEAVLDAAMALTLIVMLISPVALAGMLGISLGQAIRHPKARHRPGLERWWLLKQGDQTVGKLRLQPEALRLHLVWVSLQPDHREQGIGTAFVRAVLQAENLPCRVKLPGNSAMTPFFQGCGFRRSPERQHGPPTWRRRAFGQKTIPIWMDYDPKSL